MSSAGRSPPRGLWGLWVFVIKYDVRLLIVRMAHLERFEKELRGHMPMEEKPLEPQMAASGVPMWTSDAPDAFTTESGRKWIWAHIGPMRDELAPLGLSASQLEIQYIWNHADRWTRKQLAAGFAALRWTIEQELNEKFFVFLDKGGAELFECDAPFGSKVAAAFPSANRELKEAAQCIALDKGTASVFYAIGPLRAELARLRMKWGRHSTSSNGMSFSMK